MLSSLFSVGLVFLGIGMIVYAVTAYDRLDLPRPKPPFPPFALRVIIIMFAAGLVLMCVGLAAHSQGG